ncbi:MAG TPA: IS1595 family transposase [Myxococcota bacterium]|nr:IS1595 family transposase [Myxococcota bacterium]
MARDQGKVGEHKSVILRAIPAACKDEGAAVEFVEQLRWNGEAVCPRCGSVAVAQIKSLTGQRGPRYLWRCYDCKRQFTVRIGTIFEDSRIPMRIWCHGFWRACSSKKGVSALQISRETGLSYKSALFLMHRIRFAMASDGATSRKLERAVEADETFVGGKPRHPREEREKWSTKAPVFAVVERGGEVRARPIERVNATTVRAVLREYVKRDAKLYTDEATHYAWAGKPWAGGHETVNHSAGEYVRGSASTNTVEGFFSLIKRGMYGTFHSVSKKHLHRYVSEFEFRYNSRHVNDGDRTLKAIQSVEGKRLTYRAVVS